MAKSQKIAVKAKLSTTFPASIGGATHKGILDLFAFMWLQISLNYIWKVGSCWFGFWFLGLV